MKRILVIKHFDSGVDRFDLRRYTYTYDDTEFHVFDRVTKTNIVSYDMDDINTCYVEFKDDSDVNRIERELVHSFFEQYQPQKHILKVGENEYDLDIYDFTYQDKKLCISKDGKEVTTYILKTDDEAYVKFVDREEK